MNRAAPGQRHPQPASADLSRVPSLCALLQAIDWQAPWLAHLRAYAPLLQAELTAGASVAQALNALAALPGQVAPPQFVAQSELPAGQAYEDFIFKTRRVPTRDNLHDLFNGLCWLQFPAIKARLNQLQADQIEAGGVLPTRGPVRDALTVFDENAALLHAPEPLWQALKSRDWQRLFVDLRPLWQQAELLLFGHALLEKLVQPRKPITAHVYLVAQAPGLGDVPSLDRWIAQDLSAGHLAGKPFAPLPVLGVPGWWAANADLTFYDDAQVFRPPARGA